jgi:hypothetical protein
VRLDGMALEHVRAPSAAVALAAVEQNWRALRFVHASMQSPDVLRAALEQSGLALQHAAAQPAHALCLLPVVFLLVGLLGLAAPLAKVVDVPLEGLTAEGIALAVYGVVLVLLVPWTGIFIRLNQRRLRRAPD